MTDSDSGKDKAERSWSLIGSPKSRSISRDLTAGLILTVVVVSTIAILFSYFDASRKARSQLEDKADEYLVSLTDILEIPLWNLDDRTIEHIGASYAQNELVQELRVMDSWGTAYFEFEKESGESQTSRASEIFHENESIGQVELSLTSRYYTEINRQLLGSSIFTILINLLSLIIVIGFLSRMLLGKPLERLGEIVNSYASDEYDSSGHHMPFVEFQPLVTVLGEMGDKITAQMTELQEHRQHLEDLVEQRTEELSQRNIELGREIGERKRAEEEVLREKLLSDSIVDNVPAGIAFLDDDFVLRKCNHTYAELIRTYTPYTPEQALGMSYFDYAPGSRPQVEEWFQKVRDTGQVDTRYGFKLVLKRDGQEETSYWDTSVAPVLDAEGKAKGILILTQDVTERKRAEEEIGGLARFPSENTNPVLRVAKDGTVLYANKASFPLLNVWGCQEGQCLPEDWREFTWDVLSSGISEDAEVEVGDRVLSLTFVPVVHAGYVNVYGFDITERLRAEEELAYTATHDPLTGVSNRLGFFTLAEQQLKMADRTKTKMLLLFADFDHLKQINDTFGHNEGDRALTEVANALQETFRESDIIGRIGGDEFVVLAIETDEASAEILSTRLQEDLEARNTTGGRRYELSLSVGVAHYDPEHPCSVDELLARADRSMYEKKQDNQRS